MSESKISLSINETVGSMVVAHSEGAKLTIDSMAQIPLFPAFFEVDTETVIRQEAQALEKLSASVKLKQKNVNIIIPDALSYSQITTMPILKEKELLAAIKYQADQFIPMPIDETSLDLQILYEDKKNKRLTVLIVAASNKIVSKIERTVEMAGLIPESLENELCASSRFISAYYHGQSSRKTLFVNLGYSSTSLYYFDPDVRLVTDTHTFKLGIALFLKELQMNLRLDAAKAQTALKSIGFSARGSVDLENILQPTLVEFVGQVEKFLISVKERHKDSGVDTLIFFNKIQDIPTLAAKVAQRFALPSAIFDPSMSLQPATVILPHQSDLSAYICNFGGCL